MARVRDWVELGKDTISSLKTSDMAALYGTEWPSTREMLIGDQKDEIEREPRRLRRFVRTRSAILFGIAKRLAPLRRIIFVVVFVWFFACLFTIFAETHHRLDWWLFVEVAATFIVMTLLLAMELIDKIKFRDELELARDLQAHLLPANPPQTEEYAIAAFNRIANTVGGDIYDFVPLPDGRLAILFGDASGHGMAAGLMMAVAHAAFRTQLDVDPSPASIVGSLNRILCRAGGKRSFFSACYFLIERDGSYVATVAGHPQVLRIGADGKVAERIGFGSYPLGIKPSLVWPELRGSLAPGEQLLFHSDGLTEARNADDSEFGDAYVESIVACNANVSAAGVVDALVNAWTAFSGGKAEDDVSIAVIARR
jgi:sigma-B regulation protein RsbU (phosphoserine phosphatase)